MTDVMCMAGRAVSYNPLYLQARDTLFEHIVDGLYRPGRHIPNELRLAIDFGTSIRRFSCLCLKMLCYG
jgi:DNA-binding GntR family transcriptional regulator